MNQILGFLPLPVAVFLGSFLLSAVMGMIMIPWLRKLKMGQTVREDGLKSHYTKNGTPTMGGLIFLSSMVIIGIVLSFSGYQLLPYMLLTIGCGVVGFYDDWLKVVRKHNKGVSGKQKMIALGFLSVLFIVWCVRSGTKMNYIAIPFVGIYDPWIIPVWLSGLFALFLLLAFTNGANLTDGVDGLAGSVSLVAFVAFGVIFSFQAENDEVRLFCALMAGSVLGYLLYNIHPAKVFMGDTGSLALGGAVTCIAIATGMPLFLIIICGIYAIEDLSVMIQVFWFKRTGKRVFLMAPIHHHFEMAGWKETKIVKMFTAVGVVLGLIAIAATRWWA